MTTLIKDCTRLVRRFTLTTYSLLAAFVVTATLQAQILNGGEGQLAPTGSGETPPTNTPAPNPPAPRCPLFKFTVTMSGMNQNLDNFIKTADLSEISCLSSTIENARKVCASLPSVKKNRRELDDCVFCYFFSTTDNSNIAYQKVFKGRDPSYSAPFGSVDWQESLQRPITVYLKPSCDVVPKPLADTNICDAGTYEWAGSPISLIWQDTVDLESDQRIATFKLNPYDLQSSYLWKASSEAPLLVWDPDRTGRIRDGAQLFGLWTFGGNRLASLSGSAGLTPSAWKTGYEPLSLLDADSNGELRGEELESLSLWFDHNRDGVSQSGEVLPLSELQVEAIFTKPDGRDRAGNVRAARGYERVVAGKRVVRPSVDWFTKGARTSDILINNRLAATHECRTGQASPDDARANNLDKSSEKPAQNRSSLVTTLDQLNGIWAWTMIDEQQSLKDFAPKGFLSFQIKEGGAISGRSYSQIRLNERADVASAIRAAPLNGESLSESEISFALAGDPQSQTTVKSKAMMLPDGSLLGTTTVSLTEDQELSSFSYKWSARKLTRLTR